MALTRDLTVTQGVSSVLNAHATTLDTLVADVETLRAKLVTLLTKLDADGGVTDADYVTSCTPGATLTSTSEVGETISG